MSTPLQTAREYWIGIIPSEDAPLNIFGPYTLPEATDFREKWVKSYPTSARISTPFQADLRDQANLNAAFHMRGNRWNAGYPYTVGRRTEHVGQHVFLRGFEA